MKSEKIKLPFGFNQNNEPVHINQVKRGKKCNLVCPACREPLIAVKGNTRQHHFRHEVESECARNPESAIHSVAKKMIAREMKINLPKYECSLSGRDSKGIEHKTEPETVVNGGFVYFDSVQEEKELHGMIVDILAEKDNKQIIVEIFYRHKVDDQKREKIIKAKISAIEIDLSSVTYDDLNDLDAFWRYLNDPARSKWLYSAKAHEKYHPKHERKLAIMIENAERKYEDEKITKQKQVQQEVIRRQKHEQRERTNIIKLIKNEAPVFSQSLEDLKLYQSIEYITQLKRDAETHPAWKLIISKHHLSLNEIPNFLNVDVPDGAWIFGCDIRIWQTAIYYYFIKRKHGKDYFSIMEVDEWLQDTVGCKSPRCVKIVGNYEKRNPELMSSDPNNNFPSTWRTLQAYFKHLFKLNILTYLNYDPRYLGNYWYGIMREVPEITVAAS
jgi:hypothetical protein